MYWTADASDPEHQRYAQTSLSGVTFYLAGAGVLAERFASIGGTVRWTNFPVVGGRYIGIQVENSDETTLTRYFHTDHLGSIAVITNEAAVVMERLSYDAWGVRRNPDGTPDPSGSVASQSSRGFTGHEHLAEVGLIHMNGRVYDPLLARFGTPDPTTEDPFSTQGWNRYTYVGNSPVNFTDPSGYCFLGCFWKPIFKAIGTFLKQAWGSIVQIAATAICVANPVCAPFAALVAGAASAVVTGITSGNLGLALRAGITAFFTAQAFTAVGDSFPSGSLGNVAGHALVGCASAVMQGGKCGPGALSAGITAFAGPMINGKGFSVGSLIANTVIGGVASVAAGGKFANGAVTAAFGYLFNEVGDHTRGCWPCKTADEAAMAALMDVNQLSIEENREYGGIIYKLNGSYWYTGPFQGGEDGIGTMTPEMRSLVPEGGVIVGDYHTHGDYATKENGFIVRTDKANDIYRADDFSRLDKLNATADGMKYPGFKSYLGTPSWQFRYFDVREHGGQLFRPYGAPFP